MPSLIMAVSKVWDHTRKGPFFVPGTREFSLGRPPCSAGVAIRSLGLPESTALGSSLPSVVGRVRAGGRGVSALGFGGR
jgi:hypothetical protein